MGIQNEVLGGQRRAREHQIGQKERLVGNPGRALTAEAPGAQPGSSEGLLKRSLSGWGFSSLIPFRAVRKTPENLKGRSQRSGGEGEWQRDMLRGWAREPRKNELYSQLYIDVN